MEHLGSELKKAREASGISIHEMAARTKISITALECLERNDFSRLPGGIFGRAFVRSYAVEVGMEPDAAVSRFSDLLEQAEREEAERKAAMRPEITLDDKLFFQRQQRALLALRVVLVLVVVGAMALVIWQGRAYLQRRAAARAAAAATPVPAPVPAPPPPAPIAAPAADAAGAAAVSSEAAPAPAATAAALVVEFEVTAQTSLSAAADGAAPAFSRQFQAGEHPRIEAEREVIVDVGNAGAVRLTINGTPARPLGRDGERQRARITRDNLAAFVN